MHEHNDSGGGLIQREANSDSKNSWGLASAPLQDERLARKLRHMLETWEEPTPEGWVAIEQAVDSFLGSQTRR